MIDITELLLLGLGAGALYALAALGLVLVYRSSGVVNFAHGATGMVGTFAFFELASNSGWTTLPSLAVGAATSTLLGVVTYVLTVRLPRGGAPVTKVIATLAVLLIIQSAGALHYDAGSTRVVKQFLPTGAVNFGGGITVGADRLLLLGIGIVLTAALAAVYRHTKFGVATSAVAESSRTLSTLGWRVDALQAANWGIGGALAGIAGILLSPIAGVSVSNGTLLLVPVLAAALIGNLGSFLGTLLGGLLIGVLQAEFSRHNFGIPGLADSVPFLVIIVVLVVRGHRLPLRSFIGDRLPQISAGRVHPLGVAISTAAVVLCIGIASDDWVSAILTTLLFAIVALSLVVILGYAGQISLAQMTTAGCGALIAAKLTAELSVPFVVSAPIAVLAAVPIGALLGLPSLRTRGVSLAIATLGLAVAINALIFNNQSLSGGDEGVVVSSDGTLEFLGWDIDALLHPRRYALLALAVFVIAAIAVANLRRGRAGRRMIAVRSNERAAAALGVDVVAVKLWAFALAAAIASAGGVLMAFRFQAVLFSQFGIFDNIALVAYVIVGGVGSVIGAAVGGTLAVSGVGSQLLHEVAPSSAKYVDLIGGATLLLVVLAMPDGVVSVVGKRLRGLLPVPAPRLAALPGGTARHSAGKAARVEAVVPKTLEARSVSVHFGGIVAVNGVDLTVEPGEVLSVIGPNGAGKTTLIDAITGFADAEGSIRLGGEELAGVAAHRRARAGLSRSFQSLELFEDLSVLENLACSADPNDAGAFVTDLVHPSRCSTLTSATRAAIDTFALGDKLDVKPRALSAGHRRLVAMARAIAGEPSVVLLDEPCAGLDAQERGEVRRLIRSLADDWKMGVLLVEHDVDVVRDVSDNIVVLDFGRVIADGPPEGVLAEPRVLDAYLGALDFDVEADAGTTTSLNVAKGRQ